MVGFSLVRLALSFSSLRDMGSGWPDCRRLRIMSSHFSRSNSVFAFGLPFPKEANTPIALRDSIRTLLGPKPLVKTTFGPAEIDRRGDIQTQKSALMAYRAKIVALMNVLEGAATTPANEPVSQAPQRSACTLRRPIAGARSVKTKKETAA